MKRMQRTCIQPNILQARSYLRRGSKRNGNSFLLIQIGEKYKRLSTKNLILHAIKCTGGWKSASILFLPATESCIIQPAEVNLWLVLLTYRIYHRCQADNTQSPNRPASTDAPNSSSLGFSLLFFSVHTDIFR